MIINEASPLLTVSLAFGEGLALLFSPCILPVLPIIFASSYKSCGFRHAGIITGFALSFVIWTISLRGIIEHSGIKPEYVSLFAYTLLLILAIIMLSNRLTHMMEVTVQGLYAKLSKILSSNQQRQADTAPVENFGSFIAGMTKGAILPLIWIPCRGDILTLVSAQIAGQSTDFWSFMVLGAFSLGAVIPMVLIACLGTDIYKKFGLMREYGDHLRKGLAAIILIMALYHIYKYFMA